MKFLCGSCRTKYQISEEKIRGKVLTIRCQKCNAKIKVRETAEADQPYVAEVVEEKGAAAVRERAVAGSSVRVTVTQGTDVENSFGNEEVPTRVESLPSEADAEVEWYSAVDGEQTGPFPYAELVRMIAEREVLPGHYVWNQRMDGWKRLRDVPELARLIPAEKKPKPPPPPARETSEVGEVVDLAEKRAELERSKKGDRTSTRPKTSAKSKNSTSDSGIVVDDSLAPSKPSGGFSLEGGSILKSERPEAAALLSKAEVPAQVGDTPDPGAPAPVGDELMDDLFEGIPRLDKHDTPIRESTKVFIAAAGVNRQNSRNKMGLIIGLIGAIGAAGFLGAWASGLVDVKIPGIGNVFDFSNGSDSNADNLDAPTEEELAEAMKLGEEAVAAMKRRERRPVERRPASPSAASDLPVQENRPTVGSGPRGELGAETITIDPLTGQSRMTAPLPKAVLPESRPDTIAPPPPDGELSESAIKRVVDAGRLSMKLCYEKALAREDGLKGKVVFRVLVAPSGEVTKVSLAGRRKNAATDCMSDKIKDWRFPKFAGSEPQPVEVPFILE